jgi:hypothetical protein
VNVIRLTSAVLIQPRALTAYLKPHIMLVWDLRPIALVEILTNLILATTFATVQVSVKTVLPLV